MGGFLLVLCFGKTWHHRLHENELFADKRNDISLGLGPIFWMKQSEEEQASFRKRGISWTRGILLTCFDSAESRRWKDVTWLCFFWQKNFIFSPCRIEYQKWSNMYLSKHSKISQVIGFWFMIHIFDGIEATYCWAFDGQVQWCLCMQAKKHLRFLSPPKNDAWFTWAMTKTLVV